MESGSTFEEKLKISFQEGWMSKKLYHLLLIFYQEYKNALHDLLPVHYDGWFDSLLTLVREHDRTPFFFQPYHQKIRSPFDYYAFGNQFFKLLIDEKKSTILGKAHIEEVISSLARGENVIFLSNHQTEADPLALSVLLDTPYPGLVEDMIFVAGERVITDPLAIPFSMGRNLLCIYSKRHIDYPPGKKMEKQQHNKKTMMLMSLILKEGGKCIYVAPSGGRDRRNSQGEIEVARFDSQTIEMFYLMAQKAKTPTHFYPMALLTYDLFPPPETIQNELGEVRYAKRGPIHLAVGSSIDMEHFPGYDVPDKQVRRRARASHIWQLVVDGYQSLQNL